MPNIFGEFEDILVSNNFTCTKFKENLVITPKPWSSYSFVGIDQSINVLEEWMELKNHRKLFKRADPFIQEIFSYKTYTSTAQREAILHMIL